MLKETIKTSGPNSKTIMTNITKNNARFKVKNKPLSMIDVIPGQCSRDNKERVVTIIEKFLNSLLKLPTQGHDDQLSTIMRRYLESKFYGSTWVKNSSQNPFDLYSVDALVAVENKTIKVSGSKKVLDSYGFKEKIIANASIYPDKAKVKDVVPKKWHKHYSDTILDKFMDVIVVVIDRSSVDDSIVRFAIVDGNIWGVTYNVYKGNKEVFKIMNDPLFKDAIHHLFLMQSPENEYFQKLVNKELPFIFPSYRKLTSIRNPNKLNEDE